MSDFVFLQIEQGRYLIGIGPFDAREAPPKPASREPSFYLNDFELSERKPWIVPTSFHIVGDLDLLFEKEALPADPLIEWEELRSSEFRDVFDEIQMLITAGNLEKSVPVVTERGQLICGNPCSLIRRLGGIGERVWAYGWRFGDRGTIGATPEQLFSIVDGHLESMALAGTASKQEAGIFSEDPKEIREHEFVADYLVKILSTLGSLQRDQRKVIDLGTLVHFLTRFRIELTHPNPDPESVVRLMHPTPALGAFPRCKVTMSHLLRNRKRLRAPERFGAPLGVLWDNQFQSVIAIRGVIWEGREILLPSGCGLIEGSRFDREWEELSLKRNAVKAQLGL